LREITPPKPIHFAYIHIPFVLSSEHGSVDRQPNQCFGIEVSLSNVRSIEPDQNGTDLVGRVAI